MRRIIKEDIAKIESLVRLKKAFKAKALITHWLRNYSSPEAQFMAAQWYRRLSLYNDALRLVLALNPFDPLATRSAKILTAEVFTHIGSISYALQIVQHLTPETEQELDIFAGIYYSANIFDKAASFLERRIAKSNFQTRDLKMAQLSYADCLAKIGQLSRAIEICRQLLSEADEVLFQAICNQALGEYLSRMGKYDEALKYLLESQKMFPGTNDTFDHALLYRWLGFAYAKLNQNPKARYAFARSTKIIKNIGLGDDVWLDNLRLEAEVGFLSRKDHQRLDFFPIFEDLKPKFKKNKNLALGGRRCKFKIYFSSDEFVHNQDHWLGIPAEIKLVGFLRIAEDWGVGFETIKALFWPNEGQTYPYLDARIRQMVKRIKARYKINIIVIKKRLFLQSSSQKKIFVNISLKQKLPRKIPDGKAFTRKQFEKWYNLKKAQAARKLEDLCLQNLLTRKRGGRNSFYITS